MKPLRPLTRSLSTTRQYPRCLFRLCLQTCLFHNTTAVPSGHSRWSKIKHDKGANDAAKNRQRSVFAQEIATASRLFGPDPNTNTRLAFLITTAKRAGFAKHSIESSIARGQGRSASGAALEPITVEAILPHNIACIVECESDSRLRTLQEVKHAVKEAGGNATPVSYLFTKKGRIVFEAKEGVGIDEVLEPALEAGAVDVDEEDGAVVATTEPSDTKAVGEALTQALGLQIELSEIFWDVNEDTVVDVDSESTVKDLLSFVDLLESKEGGGVVGIYLNIRKGEAIVDDGAWADLMDRIGA